MNAHLRLADLIEKRLYIEHNRIKYKRKNRNIILLWKTLVKTLIHLKNNIGEVDAYASSPGVLLYV